MLFSAQPCSRILQSTALATLRASWRVFLLCSTTATGLMGFCMSVTTAIWPHELFSGLFHHHPQAFKTFILGGGPSVVKDFWSQLPPRRGMEQRRQWRELCIPIGGHGDGVAISMVRGKASKTVDSLCWTSLLSSAPTKYSVYYIWM